MSGIVISYRREDTEGSSGRLYDRLVPRYGDEFVFMDFYSIESGEDWLAKIDETVASSDVMLAIIGPRWSTATDDAGRRRLEDERDYVRREILTALKHNVRVLPVLVQGARMVAPESLPSELAPAADNEAFSLDSKYYDRDVERLFRFIDRIVGFGADIPRFDQRRTAVAGFVGLSAKGPTDVPVLLTKWPEFEYTFGDFSPGLFLAHSVHGWFINGGGPCFVARVGDDQGNADIYDYRGEESSGIIGLERVDEVTIVAAPDIVGLYGRGMYGLEQVRELQLTLISHCEQMGNRMAVLDPPPDLIPRQVNEWANSRDWDTKVAALYYPWLRVPDPAGTPPFVNVPPSGHIAGMWARNDEESGVWAAPANQVLRGALALQYGVTNEESFVLQRANVNAIRPVGGQGIRVWGSRTLSSDPAYADIANVRMIWTVGTFVRDVSSWAAFERSNQWTWNRLRSSVEAALEALWRRTAFAGRTAAEAFFVNCDGEVNVPELAAAGRTRVEFGFALKFPGEFTRMAVEQPSGDIQLFAD
jgi:hypothetical protein